MLPDKKDTIESHLFDWDGWDEAGESSDLQFYNCVLKVDIKDFKAGEKFAVIAMIMSKSVMEFYRNGMDEQPVASLPMRLQVG